MSSSTQVRYDVAGGVATITLDGPSRRNAIGQDTAADLEEALLRAGRDQARVVVLAGAGGAFSAGGDLKSVPAVGVRVGNRSERLARAHRVLRELRGTKRIVVAAVEGPAVGIGWSLAMACDLVVAAESAYFAAPFIDRGLVPDGGIAWLLATTVGPKVAAELLMQPQRITAERAQQFGLVNKIVASGTATAQATEWARELATGPADALLLTKAMLSGVHQVGSYEAFLDLEWPIATLAMNGAEAAEGIAAFGEKRPPNFPALHDAVVPLKE